MDSPKPYRIALIDHDAAVAGGALATLRRAGHLCRPFASGAGALDEIDIERFDLLLVGPTLPDMSTAELMGGIRARHGYALPMICLVPPGEPDRLVAALHDGADDCLASPVPPRLLLAQVNAAMRRSMPRGARIEAAVGHLRFQSESNRVHIDGNPVVLTAKEYALGLMLCRNLGRPLERDHILETIWGEAIAPMTRTLDVHVSRLRAKLDLHPDRGFRLSALYGRGYQLDHGAMATAERPMARTALIRSLPPAAIAAPVQHSQRVPRARGRQRDAASPVT